MPSAAGMGAAVAFRWCLSAGARRPERSYSVLSDRAPGQLSPIAALPGLTVIVIGRADRPGRNGAVIPHLHMAPTAEIRDHGFSISE